MKCPFHSIILGFLCIYTLKLNAQTFTGTTGTIGTNPVETSFTASVNGLPGNLTTANGLAEVCINITHQITRHLQIYLVAPNGTRRGLVLNKTGTAFTNTCFTMTATNPIGTAVSPHTGTYLPENGFSCWNNIGMNGNGTWRLVIRNYDAAATEVTGRVVSWSLNFGPASGMGCNGNPAAADICSNAAEICTFNGYCGNTTGCYAPDLTGSNIAELFSSSCAPNAVEIHNNSWLTFVANQDTVKLAIDVTNCHNTDTSHRGIQLFITSTKDCKTFEGNYGCYYKVYGKRTLSITGLTKNNRYYLMIDGAVGDVCDYSIKALSGVKMASASASVPVICPGESSTLTAEAVGTSPTITYSWSSNPPGFSSTSKVVQVNPTVTTTYIVAIADCDTIIKATALVTVRPIPSPSVFSGPTTICSGNNTTLTASAPLGNSYKWYDAPSGGTLIHTGDTYTTPVLTSTTTYYVEATSAAGCTNTDKTPVTVTVNETPVSPVVTGPTTICSGTSTSLTAVSPGASTYKWYDAATGGNLLYTGDTYITPALYSSTTYYVEAETAAACTSVSRTPVTITVSQLSAQFTANPMKGPAPLTVNFSNTSANATSYDWDFGDHSGNSQDLNPSHTYSKKGEGATIEVKLIATDIFGCKDTALMTIIVDPFSKLIVPNVFTPNNDQINDQFKVESIGLSFIKAELYSRWGLKVYEWNTVNEGWDGRTASGMEAPAGTYYYMIVAKGVNGKEYEFRGHFTLLR